MKISQPLRSELLALPWVGDGLVVRLEQAGLDSLERLQQHSVTQIIDILAPKPPMGIYEFAGWARSSRARRAIQAVLSHVRKYSPVADFAANVS